MISQAEAIEQIKKKEAKRAKNRASKINKEIKYLNGYKSRLTKAINKRIVDKSTCKHISVWVPIRIIAAYLSENKLQEHLEQLVKEIINDDWEYEIEEDTCDRIGVFHPPVLKMNISTVPWDDREYDKKFYIKIKNS